MHRIVGNAVCSFSCNKIDAMVDSYGSHDASRYDIDVLEKDIEYIKSEYSDQGLCYFVLHHYLDRLVDILVSLMCNYYVGYALKQYCDREVVDLRNVYYEMKSIVSSWLRTDPKNILSILVNSLDDLLRAVDNLYIGKSRRKQRELCRNNIRKAYTRIAENKELLQLTPIVKKVVNTRTSPSFLDCVICMTLLDEGFKTKGTLKKLATAINTKLARYRYYSIIRSPAHKNYATALSNEETIIEFVSKIISISCNVCKEEKMKIT